MLLVIVLADACSRRINLLVFVLYSAVYVLHTRMGPIVLYSMVVHLSGTFAPRFCRLDEVISGPVRLDS